MGQYKIYADNYYGGIDLAKDTQKRGFGFTFNCRVNRPTWLFKDCLDEEQGDYSISKLAKFACSGVEWRRKEGSGCLHL
jgi:hypothetical protein